MPHIHIFLQELDRLYHAGDFDQYEQTWQTACQHAEHFFEKGVAQTNTVVAKIKTVVEITEETVNNLDAGLKEVVQDHKERIEAVEEEQRST